MPAAITCGSCRRPLRVPEHLLGQKVRCPLCTDVFIAEPNPPPPSVKPLIPVDPPAFEPQHPAEALYEKEAQAALYVRPLRPNPATPRTTDDVAAPPFHFRARIRRDPYRVLNGPVYAEVTYRGLRLVSEKKEEVFVPLGTPVRYLGSNRLRVPLDDREIELAVGNLTIYRQRLARDVATFLSGDRQLPWPADYRWPWYIYLLWLAPSGLPFLAASVHETDDAGGVVFLCGLLAVALVLAGYSLIQYEKWAPRLRLALAAGASLSAYALVVWASAADPPLQISEDNWQELRWPEVFQLRMPGTPVVRQRQRGGQSVAVYVVDLPRQQAVFTFGYVDLPTGPRNPTERQLNLLFEEGVQALQRETRGVTRVADHRLVLKNGACPGHEYVCNVSNRTLKGKLVAQMYYDQGRLYTLAVAGKTVQPQLPDVRAFFDSFWIE